MSLQQTHPAEISGSSLLKKLINIQEIRVQYFTKMINYGVQPS